MIKCYINGQKAIPLLTNNLKVTRENPFVKEGSEYTMDITFPMNILENRRVFGHLSKLGVRIRTQKLDSCRLLAENRIIISGTGIVTQITQEAVKVQVVSGASSVKWRSSFEKIFINRIDYGSADVGASYKGTERFRIDTTGQLYQQLTTQGFIGNIHQCVFMPAYDSTNDVVVNATSLYGDRPVTPQSVIIGPRAVQPNLMMVLHTVLRHLGYTVTYNAYDVAPWNELIICSVTQTSVIAKALPQWSAKKFLDEFSNLFNATFIFDDEAGTVRVVRRSDTTVLGNETETIEPVDEFTAEYDEDGLEYIGSSNIDYNLKVLEGQVPKVPQEVLKNFTIREYDSFNDIVIAAQQMTEKEQLTTLFAAPGGFYYEYEVVDGEGNPQGYLDWKLIGIFTQLTRDSDNDSVISLGIVPVAIGKNKRTVIAGSTDISVWVETEEEVWLPEVEGIDLENGSSFKDYVTIENVIENGDSADSKDKDEETVMQILWPCGRKFEGYATNSFFRLPVILPQSYTDWRIGQYAGNYSLGLTHAGGHVYVGQFHERTQLINSEGTIDPHNEYRISFLSDHIPNPASIYMIRNKRYLCSKIEMTIDEKGVDKLITGNFYEILS